MIPKRILVAMSGGVDSSTTAALLLKQGMKVEGVTLKLTSGLCCDIGSAQEICKSLRIPHRTIDMREDFSQSVIENFISEYRHGRTPNPCIRCNEIIKFGLLLKYSRMNNFDFVATGHYARIEYDPLSSRFLLKRGIDPIKDQSYFLYRLSQEQLQYTLFPLGEMQKTDVRSLAKELGLPDAERPESQEICFVPNNNYRAFFKEHAPEALQPGDLVLSDGTVVGRHEGVAFFTIGQRRKVGYAAGERVYVVKIDPVTRRIVLGKISELRTTEMVVSNIHFIAFDKLWTRMNITVKIRYRTPFIPAVIEPLSTNKVRVIFKKAVLGVCPGQAAVFYEGDTIIGGGIIEIER
ncbi:MAG TPA: tRNA 2-thiouridine(34) synthase MnmA [Nitrospirota bacterium]|nr:tRNA 2-thiouridine(34) synthase MnmA [Nitrospirota bacterium]